MKLYQKNTVKNPMESIDSHNFRDLLPAATKGEDPSR